MDLQGALHQPIVRGVERFFYQKRAPKSARYASSADSAGAEAAGETSI
jgi:hypothetical protein